MRVALIQSAERQDGKALSVARTLRAHGHEVVLLVPQREALPLTPALAAEWQAEGFASIPIGSARIEPAELHFPRDRALAAARRLSDLVVAFDTAWFFERHWAMPTLRDRRFRDKLLPLVVLDDAPDAETVPESLEEMNRANSCRYALKWADLVCGSASERLVEELWRQRNASPVRTIRHAATAPALTVCIPYFEAPLLLPEALRSLEDQTCGNFTVVVVDDGSRSDAGRRGFEMCAQRYRARGWKFVRQANLYPGAARNRAAREAETEYLFFLDADDLAAPTLVERCLRAALLTGDDCLVTPNLAFQGAPDGPCTLLYEPPGNSLIGSMVDDMHGGSSMIVKREAFWSAGGFSETRGLGFEDHEFHVRFNRKGLAWDVMPDLVHRYRMPAPSSISRSTPAYGNLARVRACYEEHLRGTRLEQLPLALAAAYWGQAGMREREGQLGRKRDEARRGLRLLLLTFLSPFADVSGGSRRLREIIRYLGSRYELTLVSAPAPLAWWGSGREEMRYLKALREVEWSARFLPGNGLPQGVRHRFRDTFRYGLRALPTREFDAVLIDTIFMAEFRHDVESVCVLLEQNIESSLLQQGVKTLPGEEAEELEGYENRTWPEFPLRTVVSEADRFKMDRRVKVGKTVVVPNGADPSRWLGRARHDTGVVLFPGHLSYGPNVDAVQLLTREIWPEVRKRKPGARLIVAGRLPSDEVRTAVAAAPGAELHANPKSMDTLARRASITVAPLRFGSGTRLKILESMALGLPVVSTTLGVQGIDAYDGEHLMIRDGPRDFAEAMVMLMSDQALWGRFREAGRALIRERYCWDRALAPLEDGLIELVS